MTEQEILEGKKIICAYLGWEMVKNNYPRCPNTYPLHNINDIENTGWMEMHLDNLPFDTVLDWLMPVFSRIEDVLLIGHDNDLGDWRNYCVISTFSKRIGVRIRGFRLHQEETLVLSAFAAVVEALIAFKEQSDET